MKIRIEVCVPVVTAIKGTLIKHIDCHQKSDFQFKLEFLLQKNTLSRNPSRLRLTKGRRLYSRHV